MHESSCLGESSHNPERCKDVQMRPEANMDNLMWALNSTSTRLNDRQIEMLRRAPILMRFYFDGTP